jgi:endoribonuclease Dicer
MVNNDTLAALCITSGLYEHLLFDKESDLYRTTQDYRQSILRRQQAEYAAAISEMRSPGQFWHGIPAPKVRETAADLPGQISTGD